MDFSFNGRFYSGNFNKKTGTDNSIVHMKKELTMTNNFDYMSDIFHVCPADNLREKGARQWMLVYWGKR
jgi:hypothetical protein